MRLGAAAVRAALCAVTMGASVGAQSDANVPCVRVSRAWPVMGTIFVAATWSRDTTRALEAMRAARDSVRLIDSLLSSYRDDSELARVNANAGGVAQPVSPQTMYVAQLSRRYWRVSRGKFDPTVGPLVQAWGFTRASHATRVPSRATLDSLRRLVGYDRVEIDTLRRTLRLPTGGMALDFGGIAKGYALDLARAALRDTVICGGTIDLGGNVLAFGRPPAAGAGDGRHWLVGVAHPRRKGELLGVLAIDSGAVATSGDYERYVVIDGVRYGHIIDPTTGYPSQGIVSATAYGPRGEMSDGLSAVFFLLGPRAGSQLADSIQCEGALWMRDPGRDAIVPSDLTISKRIIGLFRPSGSNSAVRKDPR